MGEFLTAQMIAEEIKDGPQSAVVPQAVDPQPVVGIKATKLPKFTGLKRDF